MNDAIVCFLIFILMVISAALSFKAGDRSYENHVIKSCASKGEIVIDGTTIKCEVQKVSK